MELTEATQAEPAKREMPAVPDTLKARTTALQARFADKAEYARTGWVVTVPDGDDLHERLSDPLYWMYCASKFNVGDRLEIRNESFTHWGDYLVTAVDHIAMSVDIQCIKAIKIQQPEQIDHGTKFYSTAHEGLTDQWVVRRRNDNQVMQKGFKTAREADHHIITSLQKAHAL